MHLFVGRQRAEGDVRATSNAGRSYPGDQEQRDAVSAFRCKRRTRETDREDSFNLLLGSIRFRARTTPRQRRRFTSIAAKYVFAEGIKHGERGERSRCSSTAFARSPRRVDASARRCMILLPFSAGRGDPVRPFYPSLRFGPHLHAHSWCKSPTASFLCCRCCARHAAAAPVLPDEGETAWRYGGNTVQYSNCDATVTFCCSVTHSVRPRQSPR